MYIIVYCVSASASSINAKPAIQLEHIYKYINTYKINRINLFRLEIYMLIAIKPFDFM